jgi:hypothetical protein
MLDLLGSGEYPSRKDESRVRFYGSSNVAERTKTGPACNEKAPRHHVTSSVEYWHRRLAAL